MKSIRRFGLLLAAFCLLLPAMLAAEDWYFVPLSELNIAEGQLSPPEEGMKEGAWQMQHMRGPLMQPYVAMDQPGAEGWVWSAGTQPWTPRLSFDPESARVAVHSTAPLPLTGIIVVPRADWSGMQAARFEIAKPSENPGADRERVLETKLDYYRRLLQDGGPGSAWFRHQVRETQKALGRESEAVSQRNEWDRGGRGDLEETFDLFTGGRALSENLQLDRGLMVSGTDEATSPISSLTGITTPDYDWTAEIKGKTPKLDPLAAHIPADDLAAFFPSLRAMKRTVDEGLRHGAVPQLMAGAWTEDAGTLARYERQLGLPLNDATAAMGDQFVKSVALVASDPYVRTGTAVAMLFETNQPAPFRAAVGGQLVKPGVKPVNEKIAGVDVTGATSGDWRVSSYLAVLDGVVVLSNSRDLMVKILETKASEKNSLASTPEYTFFRDRYVLGDSSETGFVVLTDAAIRKWCNPKWRVGASRRTRAAAAMAELQAAHLRELAGGKVDKAMPLKDEKLTGGLGQVVLTPDGVRSSVYGSMQFLTPIAHLEIDRVTAAEKQAYDRWRDGYARNWSGRFDPIAVRLTVQSDKLATDVTVRPLIAGSDYNEFIEVIGSARLEAGDGDPHDGSLIQFRMAMDAESQPVRQFTNLAAQMAPNIGANPLNWVGNWMTVYADKDPFWDEMQKATEEKGQDGAEEFMETNWPRLPVVLEIEAVNGLKLAAFLSALRAWIEQTAPGMTAWEAREYAGLGYVRIGATQQARQSIGAELPEFAMYYAPTGKALILTLNEGQLKKALDRQAPAPEGEEKAAPKAEDLAGESMVLEASQAAYRSIQRLSSNSLLLGLQAASWRNIAILNEWRREFGASDALAFHSRWWVARPTCPGGGEYVWNENFQTYESAVFGCPAKFPESLPEEALPLGEFARGQFGVTFEQDGLRAKAILLRPMED